MTIYPTVYSMPYSCIAVFLKVGDRRQVNKVY